MSDQPSGQETGRPELAVCSTQPGSATHPTTNRAPAQTGDAEPTGQTEPTSARLRWDAIKEHVAVIRSEHWQTIAPEWGQSVNVPVCGRCTYGDGVPYRYPCPTVSAAVGIGLLMATEEATGHGERHLAPIARLDWNV